MSNAVANVFSKTYGGKIEAGLKLAENNILYTGIDYTYVWTCKLIFFIVNNETLTGLRTTMLPT